MRAGKGFSLLEVMIALMILATSLMVLMDSHNSSTLLNARAKGLTIANMLAQEKLTEVKLITREEGFGAFDEKEKGDFGSDYPGFRWETGIRSVPFPMPSSENIQSGGLSVGSNVIAQQLKDIIKEIKIHVFWVSGAGEESVELVTHVMDFGKMP